MTKAYKTEKINISLLDLDTQNPRFLMLYNDSHSQDDIINYLLKNENALEIVQSIYENKDFFEDSFGVKHIHFVKKLHQNILV